MSIIFIHGVGVRSDDGFREIKPLLCRYVTPAISDDPDTVPIEYAYWGDKGVGFAWGGASRPRTRLIGQGPQTGPEQMEALLAMAAHNQTFRRIPSSPVPGVAASGLVTGQGRLASVKPVRPRDLSHEEVADVLVALIDADVSAPEARAAAAIAADEIARDPETQKKLHEADTLEGEIKVLVDALNALGRKSGLVAQGAGGLGSQLRDRIRETLSRAASTPAFAVSVVAAETRPGLNEFISYFLGDVFVYLRERGAADAPGEIPRRFLDALSIAHEAKMSRGGEPLVVVSHSMGGQIVYDAVTHYLPADPTLAGLRIDFWLASASQVGFFEEAKLFGVVDAGIGTGSKVSFPRKHLGAWWNVWDHNDFLSFTGKEIFEGIDDEGYNSGLSLLSAHSGYLRRPSFHRRFAAKLAEARARGWRTP